MKRSIAGENGVSMESKCPVNMNCELYETIDTKDMYIYIGRVILKNVI